MYVDGGTRTSARAAVYSTVWLVPEDALHKRWRRAAGALTYCIGERNEDVRALYVIRAYE